MLSVTQLILGRAEIWTQIALKSLNRAWLGTSSGGGHGGTLSQDLETGEFGERGEDLALQF